MGKFKDLTGMKFNRLTVLAQAGRDRYGKILWLPWKWFDVKIAGFTENRSAYLMIIKTDG